MGQHLLSVRILFHATFSFVYLPIIVLGFTAGLNATRYSSTDGKLSFVQNHIDGIIALAALVGLGIFATLDILTICRRVNLGALLLIEIIIVVLTPLSMWPIITTTIRVIWPNWFNGWMEAACGSDMQPWYCHPIYSIGDPQIGDEVTSAGVVSATVAILALNVTFLSYICIAAVSDKIHHNTFLPIYPGERPSLSSPGTGKKWYLFGTPRTPAERAVMIGHCTSYIFRNSVFRKHTFEPTAWAIFRGIIAVYSCAGLMFFSAYSALSEVQLRGILTVKETIAVIPPGGLLTLSSALSVASFLTVPTDYPYPLNVNPEQYPPPMLSANRTSGASPWENPTPGFWTSDIVSDFNISWAGEYSLAIWVTTAGRLRGTSVPGSFKSIQANSTNPLVLAPFQRYRISLVGIIYLMDGMSFTLWVPDIIRSVESGSASSASISFNSYQPQVLVRDLNPTSMFSSVARVLSSIGGTLSAIDGVFGLIFGRSVVAILIGSRIVSPFGLLGMVTHNRFKRLIHEEYPLMQEDIERGGMAAYISEVAIDAALMDVPSTKGRIGDEAGGGDVIEFRRRTTGSSTRSIQPALVGEELGDLESNYE